MLSITSVMILPAYFACTLYLWKLCAGKNYPAAASVKLGFATICGAAGSVYALWMIYAAGLKYLAMAFIFLAMGIPFYIWARCNAREEKQLFTIPELIGAVIIISVALFALLAVATGQAAL